MGLVSMSVKDLQRIEVLTEVLAGRRTVGSAATVLTISDRQVNRLLARYQENGGFGLVNKARARTSNRSHKSGVRKFAVELVRRTTPTSGRRWTPRLLPSGT